MFFVVYCLVLIHCSLGDEKIIHVNPGCPATIVGVPHPVVRADVPAEVTAKCRNGDKIFTSNNGVKHVLSATLSQAYIGGDCQYYKKKGVNTYHVNVEIAWSEQGKEVYTKKEVRTITCSYDRHGNATSSREQMANPFLNPSEKQHLKGIEHVTANFSLAVIDVLGNELGEDHLHIGRLVRLRAFETTGTVGAFRALSCTASNKQSIYAILRAGCGDGLVFEKAEGFQTVGSVVYSPYFDAFKLHGSEKVHFECNFTVCDGKCDGDSCRSVVSRSKRSILDNEASVKEARVDGQKSNEAATPAPSSKVSTEPKQISPSPSGSADSKLSSSSKAAVEATTASPLAIKSTVAAKAASASSSSTETKSYSVSPRDCPPTPPSISMMIASGNMQSDPASNAGSIPGKVQLTSADVKAAISLSFGSRKIDAASIVHKGVQDTNGDFASLKGSPGRKTSVQDVSKESDVVVSSLAANQMLESVPTSEVPIQQQTFAGLPVCVQPPSVLSDAEMLTIMFCVFGFLLLVSFFMSLYLCCKYELAQIRLSIK